jgi:SAM-dependent methyltransferase
MEASRKEAERQFHNERFGGEDDIRKPLNKWYSAMSGCLRLQVNLIRQYGKNAVVLEYGCGDGRFSLGDNHLPDNTARFHGIDISDAAVERARDRARSQGLANCEFTVMDAEQLTFADGKFDVVFGQGILHHLDLAKSLNEILRVLRPGGIAVFCEPMGHNPLINRFRDKTPEMRTPDEHPLLISDIRFARTVFGKVDVHFFGLATLAAVPFRNYRFGKGLKKVCERLDSVLLRIPVIQKHAWFVHLTLMK